jgi:hypothetical protein
MSKAKIKDTYSTMVSLVNTDEGCSSWQDILRHCW